MVDLRVHTVGGVVAPRNVLMENVPDKHTLRIEAKVRPEDLADLVPGQPVDVQVMAFKQRDTPMLPGLPRALTRLPTRDVITFLDQRRGV